jgi:hypothetical protein
VVVSKERKKACYFKIPSSYPSNCKKFAPSNSGQGTKQEDNLKIVASDKLNDTTMHTIISTLSSQERSYQRREPEIIFKTEII